MGLVSKLLFGIRTLTQDFVTVPDQNVLEVDPTWATVTPDPVNNRNVISGNGLSPTYGNLTATSLTMGPGKYYFAPAVTTTDDSLVNLLPAAIAVPATGAVTLRAMVMGKIASGTKTLIYSNVFGFRWRRDGTSAPALDAVAYQNNNETSINGPPYCASDKAPVALAVSGAASHLGKVRLTVNDTTGMVAGNTVTVAGVVGTTEINGVQIVTGVPDSTHLDFGYVTFVNAYSAGGTVKCHGSAGPLVIGNTIQIQAVGIKPPAWFQSETLSGGSSRYSGSGNSYLYTAGGTTSGSGTGPTGTGTGGTDGTATEDYLAGGDTCPIVWQVQWLEVFTQ